MTAERAPERLEAQRETPAGQEEPVAAASPATLFVPDGPVPDSRYAASGQKALAGTPAARWFTVQAGTFRDLNNAVQLQKMLMVYHPTVWINSVPDGQQLLHQVRVGPFANREEAERMVRYIALQGFGRGTVMLQ
jgi:cell division septation protein DedD